MPFGNLFLPRGHSGYAGGRAACAQVPFMAIRVKIRNAETGSVIDVDIEPDNKLDEIIESAASYWEKEPSAYILRKGQRMLRGQGKVIEAGLAQGDQLELLPDPEGGTE